MSFLSAPLSSYLIHNLDKFTNAIHLEYWVKTAVKGSNQIHISSNMKDLNCFGGEYDLPSL